MKIRILGSEGFELEFDSKDGGFPVGTDVSGIGFIYTVPAPEFFDRIATITFCFTEESVDARDALFSRAVNT